MPDRARELARRPHSPASHKGWVSTPGDRDPLWAESPWTLQRWPDDDVLHQPATDQATPGEGELLPLQRQFRRVADELGDSALVCVLHDDCLGLGDPPSRYVMLPKLEKNTAAAVRVAMSAKILALPAQLRRSVTWDRGTEMSQHLRFTIDTGCKSISAIQRARGRRGTNENTNGLLRQYFPKGTNLSDHSGAHLDEVARELNERPRQTLRWVTPSERLAEVVAFTG